MNSINDLFNDIINEEGTLFKNSEVFTLEYLPEIIRFRDKQLQAMTTYSKSLNSGYYPVNMEITGLYGTGKTTTVKKYFEIVKKRFDNVITIHLNCQFDVTENQMLTKIYNEIYNKKTSSGVTDYLLKKKIISYLAETEKNINGMFR